MSIPAPYSEVYLAGDGGTTVFAFGTNFKPISAGLVKCSVYLQDGYEVIPTYTVDMEGKFITISALTLPDSTVLTAPPAGSTVRIYRDMPEEQDITASQLQAFTAKQLEIALDAIVAMIQEVSYTTDHKTVRLTEPQRDIALQELGALEDEHLIYWDNTARKLVVTNYPQKDVVRCVNGLFFRLRTDPDTQEPYLQWSTDESDWHSINIDEVELQAQGAYALAGDAYTLAYATRGELNAHINNTQNPHQTSMANLTDTEITNLSTGQFLMFSGGKWKNVYSSATASWGGILGDINDQTDLQDKLYTKFDKTGGAVLGEIDIRRNSSTSSALLSMTNNTANTARIWRFAPSYSTVSLSVYPGSTETNGFRFATTGFVPASNNARYLGAASLKWKGVYTGVINNGYDIAVPVTNSADTFALESEITDINGKIPAQASTSNQLADKNFVNSSIATTIGDGTITINQGGTAKGTFTVNQSGNTTIDLDAGGATTGQSIDAEIVGTLTITDNSVVSGFSENDYLKFPGAFKLGDAESFEIAGSFISANSNSVVLRGCEPGSTQTQGVYISVAKVGGDSFLRVTVYHSTTLGDYQTIDGITALQTNTEYYFKFGYNLADNLYKIWLSTDGETYTLERSVSVTKLPGESVFINGSNYPITSVNMSDWAITKNGQMIWAGMDAPGLHQRVAKGHEVVAFQAPTAGNNYTWYRKYADGWVEQGGYVDTTNATYTTTFPVEMADTNYTIQVSSRADRYAIVSPNTALTTTGVTGWIADSRNGRVYWEVKGMAQG